MVDAVNKLVRGEHQGEQTPAARRGSSSPRAAIPAARVNPAAPKPVNGGAPSMGEALYRLRQTYGDTWSFEILHHNAYGNSVEVVGQLRANGSMVRASAVAAGGNGRSLGELLEHAAGESLRKCADALLRGAS